MLSLRDVHTFHGPIEAVRGIDLDVREGEIVCMVGGNGAGKSTTLMTISGVIGPRVGSIEFEGREIRGMPPHAITRLGISQVPEGRRIFPRLTVKENLDMGAYALRGGGPKPSVVDMVFDLFPVLKDRRRQTGGTLSGGEQQMLAIARALMTEPRLLMLDEPSLGLAPILVSRIFRTIREINSTGVTVLLVEQNARSALKLSSRGYVIEGGAITLSGSGDELLSNEVVKKAYLGE